MPHLPALPRPDFGQPAPPRPTGFGTYQLWAAGGALVSLVLMAYWPTLSGAFVADEVTVVVEGPLVHARDGWWRFWFTSQAVDYWPLWSSRLWLRWHLWGAQPLPYHACNLALHASNVLLLWAALRRLSGLPSVQAWVVTALFAVHQVGVEAVAWIIQSKTLLAAEQTDFAATHYNLGLVLERDGDRPAALAAIRQGLHCTPDFAAAHNGLGVLILMDGQRLEAAREFGLALQLQPGNSDIRRNLQRLQSP